LGNGVGAFMTQDLPQRSTKSARPLHLNGVIAADIARSCCGIFGGADICIHGGAFVSPLVHAFEVTKSSSEIGLIRLARTDSKVDPFRAKIHCDLDLAGSL
jgi:hypothetical protein